uniref:Uncharacterized protein n=1 Tax=Arundo donax TaxID=35708 RepID=A0A0A9BVU6_ARUDO
MVPKGNQETSKARSGFRLGELY